VGELGNGIVLFSRSSLVGGGLSGRLHVLISSPTRLDFNNSIQHNFGVNSTEPMYRIGPPLPTPPNENVIVTVRDGEVTIDPVRDEMRSILFDPQYAFAASWHYSRNLLFGTCKRSAPDRSSHRYVCRFCSAPDGSAFRSSKSWEKSFAADLNAMCMNPDLQKATSLSGKPGTAPSAFWKTINTLLDSWLPLRRESKPIRIWSCTFPALVDEMSRAQMARVSWFRGASYFEKKEAENLAFVQEHWLRGQRTYSQAAKTAAFILWGEFLANGQSSIGFCETCAHPFPFRLNQRFYPTSCGTNVSSLKKHRTEVRNENWRRLNEAAKTLRSRIASGKTQNPLHDIEKGRWLARFIRAASLPPGSSEFEDQRDMLLDLCFAEGNTEISREQVKTALDQFLKDIAKSRPLIVSRPFMPTD
jgi:hypothetical protein